MHYPLGDLRFLNTLVNRPNPIRVENQMKMYLSRATQRLFRNDEGTTTVEYAVLIAMILVFCVAAILSAGDVQQVLWFDTADAIQVIVP